MLSVKCMYRLSLMVPRHWGLDNKSLLNKKKGRTKNPTVHDTRFLSWTFSTELVVGMVEGGAVHSAYNLGPGGMVGKVMECLGAGFGEWSSNITYPNR